MSVVVSLACVAFGGLFAAWTFESVNLDASWMPAFENAAGVNPPRSFTGRGEPSLDELKKAAVDAETRGDVAAAAVLWRRAVNKDGSDKVATTALPRVLTSLGERLPQ